MLTTYKDFFVRLRLVDAGVTCAIRGERWLDRGQLEGHVTLVLQGVKVNFLSGEDEEDLLVSDRVQN